MPIFLLHAAHVVQAAQNPSTQVIPPLTATDSRDRYSMDEGDGLWIPEYVAWMEQIVRRMTGSPSFAFSNDQELEDDLFEDVPVAHLRGLLIEFTNRIYPGWRDRIDLPDYDDVREGCRGYCDSCDSAYRTIYGTYDGPLAEDVEEDEDADEADLDPQEREARIQRNAARAAERRQLQADQEAAEDEVIDSEWDCDEDCDPFLEHVNDSYRERMECDTDRLDSEWDAFMKERGIRIFPPLLVSLARASA